MVTNVVGFQAYPFGERGIQRLMAADFDKIAFSSKLSPACIYIPEAKDLPLSDLEETIKDTEDPFQDSIPDMGEIFSVENVVLHARVSDELHALKHFYSSLSEELPCPDDTVATYTQALAEIRSNLPLVYGSYQGKPPSACQL